MFLPTSNDVPWRPNEVTIRSKSGLVLNDEQVEYIKQLVKSLNRRYSDIANAHNAGAYRNDGTATVLNGTTTIAVSHGLSKTPGLKDIHVTPTNDLGSAVKFWISNATSTQFTINVDADPGATGATFAWDVHILG